MISKKIFVIRGAHGLNMRIWVDSTEIFPQESMKIHNHANEFNWGYGGSGPAQTALAICLHIFGDPSLAHALHQKFKWRFVGRWPQGTGFSETIDLTDFLKENAEIIANHQS